MSCMMSILVGVSPHVYILWLNLNCVKQELDFLTYSHALTEEKTTH